jgi:hypothetical protein
MYEISPINENGKEEMEQIHNEFEMRDKYQSLIVHDLRTPA